MALPRLASRIEAAADILDHRLVEIASHRSGWLQVLEAAGTGDLDWAVFCFADTTQLSLAMAGRALASLWPVPLRPMLWLNSMV